jgi:hypothetical protein
VHVSRVRANQTHADAPPTALGANPNPNPNPTYRKAPKVVPRTYVEVKTTQTLTLTPNLNPNGET